MSTKDYISLNRELWNKRTAYHTQSEFYDLPAFMAGKNSLREVELELLGDLKGKSVLHLQCHFGQDTLSLSRMGAKCCGIDLSDQAIEKARQLNEELGLDARFICCNLYDLPEHLDEQFDIVFSSYGTIGWLPDMDAWAAVVERFMKPGGRFVFVDFHPVVWMFDNDFDRVGYNYFNAGMIVETEKGTYADREASIELEYAGWNHSLHEVIGALLKQGLQLSDFREYDYSPYNCFSHTEQVGPDRYRIKHLGNKIPMLYSLQCTKAK